ncbi:hypothetical protein ACL02T_12985 [Pseudonocardia sp. RS010]|uniref:hypothetical protein n=1 Tax=Pseudonocardia sp. RS010 TaxID=3385979 RepID=UPI0039A2D523
MSVIGWILARLWDFAVWVWSLAPVHISLVLAAMLCGYIAVFLVPRDRGWLRVTLYRRPVPWAKGHDPAEQVVIVDLPAEDPIPDTSSHPIANVIPLFDRKAA